MTLENQTVLVSTSLRTAPRAIHDRRLPRRRALITLELHETWTILSTRGRRVMHMFTVTLSRHEPLVAEPPRTYDPRTNTKSHAA